MKRYTIGKAKVRVEAEATHEETPAAVVEAAVKL